MLILIQLKYLSVDGSVQKVEIYVKENPDDIEKLLKNAKTEYFLYIKIYSPFRVMTHKFFK